MKLPAKIKKLNKRERYVIFGVAGVIGFLLIATLIVGPFLSRNDKLKRNLEAKAAMLEQMRRLQSEYIDLTQRAKLSKSQFQGRQKGFTLYTFCNRLAGSSGINKDRISYMKPTKKDDKNSSFKISRVEMKFEAITLEQLTTYLYGVETSKNKIDIKKISISKKDKKQGLITAILQVETVEI
ncbi:MAG: hypothetical protein HKO68_16220 [Desulfobacterales bacterium]|nr:hypothetical protein [Desulfobacterales bacterium]